MTAALTLLALPPLAWAIDRLLLGGDLTKMIRDEVILIIARRRRASHAPRTARRGVSLR